MTAALFTGGQSPPDELTELVLCRDVYHCLPSELDKEDWWRIQSHMQVLAAESKVKKHRAEHAKKLSARKPHKR